MASYQEEPAEEEAELDLVPADEPNQACFVLHNSGGARNGASVFSSFPTVCNNSPRKAGRISKKQQGENWNLFTLPPCMPQEPTEYAAWRVEAFKTIWSKIEKNIQDALQNQITSSFQDIHRFIVDRQFCDAQLKLYLSAKAASDPHSQGGSAVVSKQLHAALVFLCNVDSSDHKNTFKDLALYLKQHACHVASLLPHNFSSRAGVGNPLLSVFKQIVGIDTETADMDILISWHKEPPNKKHPLVIIIEDAECCQSTVLANLIILLSEWVREIPLVLIIGMATSGETLRKMLPASAMRCLRIQKFMMQSSTKYLESVIKATFMEDFFGFFLGRDVIKFILRFFKSHDSTVTFFLRALKVACMEHFYSQPLSFLCMHVKQLCQLEFEDFCASLPEVLLNYAADLPSVKRHFVKNTEVSKIMSSSLYRLNLQMKSWCQVLQCLAEAGKQVEVDCTEILHGTCQLEPVDTFSKVADHTVFHGGLKAYANILTRIRDLPLSSLEKLVQEWEKLTGNLEDVKEGVKTILSKFYSEEQLKSNNEILFCSNICVGNSRTKKLLSLAFESSELIGHNFTPSSSMQASEEKPTSIEQSEIIERSSHYNYGSTNFTQESVKAREEPHHRMVLQSTQLAQKSNTRLLSKMVADLLEGMLRKYLIPIESFPFHEIICFKEVALLKQVLLAETRKKVHMDLLNLHLHWQHTSYEFEDNGCSTILHDTCLLYNLAQELGENINIYDWYQSFVSEVQSREKKEQPSKKRKMKKETFNKTLMQARFCKAASEIQLVGLLHLPTKKRPDFIHLTI